MTPVLLGRPVIGSASSELSFRFLSPFFMLICVSGGSEIVSKAMEDQIKTKPTHYQRAVAIKETDGGRSITVTFDGGRNPRPSLSGTSEKKYSNVISTMSFGCLRMVDLEGCYLSYGQRNSIRELTYTPSIKIGIQFKTVRSRCSVHDTFLFINCMI